MMNLDIVFLLSVATSYGHFKYGEKHGAQSCKRFFGAAVSIFKRSKGSS